MRCIEIVERIRQHCIDADSAVGDYIERLRVTRYEASDDDVFLGAYARLVLKVEGDAPADRRKVQQFVHDEKESRAGSVREESATAERDAIGRILQRQTNLRQVLRIVGEMFPLLRGMQAYELLSQCGYPVAVPSARTEQFLFRLGLTAGQAQLNGQFHSTMESIARAAHVGLPELDFLLRIYTGARKFPGIRSVCTSQPRCGECRVATHCHYRLYQPEQKTVGRKPIREWAMDERPRERLLNGERLSNSDLLAIILRTGTGDQSALDLARALLDKFGSLHAIEAASQDELKTVPGIGPAKAAEINAAIELGRRVVAAEADAREGLPQVADSSDIFKLFRPRFKTATQEEFLLLVLNTKNRIVREVTISIGTLNASMVHPRDVFRHALREAAAAVIFAHNHPSGDPAPSAEDRALTARLCEAGKLLGIRVLDHIVIGAQRYYSFADEGEIK